jgi:hypothetical protein
LVKLASGFKRNAQSSNHQEDTSMLKHFFLSALILSAASISYAQFGSGIVFDPTQSAHAAQQILQANQLYTTTVETERNVIGAYNLAQKMANLPQALYTSYSNVGRQQWTILTQPANTYGNSIPWMNAASAGYGAAAANQTASIPRIRYDKPNPLYYAHRTVNVAIAVRWVRRGVDCESVTRAEARSRPARAPPRDRDGSREPCRRSRPAVCSR